MTILRLPLPGTFVALTLTSWLLVLPRRFARLEPWKQRMVLEHEATHAEQMRRDGWLRFVVRYLFTGRWRAEYEMEANRANLAAYVANGYTPENVIEALIYKVRSRYFPRWWFGRAPSEAAMRAVLVP